MIQENKVVKMDSEQLRKIQLIQIDMLIVLDKICRKYDIKYILESGTLLGAVRNGKFIPWDDDIDVAMLRSEYERFCKACKKELEGTQYFLQNGETDPEYRWGYGKMIRLDSSYVRINQEHLKMKQGMFIDIFPIDGVPNNLLLRKFHSGVCLCMRKLSWAVVGKLYARSVFSRWCYKVLSLVPVQVPNKVFKIMGRLCDEKSHNLVRVLAYDGYDSLKREWYADVEEIVFEGHLFYAPKDADGWLKAVYGNNYMTPPPENKRVGVSPASSYRFPH